MAMRRPEEGIEDTVSEYGVVYVDTSLDTHLAMLVSDSDTVSHFKERMEMEHMNCFPEIGKIHILSLKIRRGMNFYRIPDSVIVWSLFCGEKEGWFLSADVSKTPGFLSYEVPHSPAEPDDVKIDAKNAEGNGEELPTDMNIRSDVLLSLPCPEETSQKKLLERSSVVTSKNDVSAGLVTGVEVEKFSNNNGACPSRTSSDGNSCEGESRKRKKRKLCHKADVSQNTVLEESSRLLHESRRNSIIDVAKEELGRQVKVIADDSGAKSHQHDIDKTGEVSSGGLLSPCTAKKGNLGVGLERPLCPEESARGESFDGKKSKKRKSKKKDANTSADILDSISGDIGKTETLNLPCETQIVREDKDVLPTKRPAESLMASECRSPANPSLDLSQKETVLLPTFSDLNALKKPEISDSIKKKGKKNLLEANIDNKGVEHADEVSIHGIICHEGIDFQPGLNSAVHANEKVHDDHGVMAVQPAEDVVSRKGIVEHINKDIPELRAVETEHQVTQLNQLEVNLESKDEKPRKRKKKAKSTGLEEKLPDRSQPAEVEIHQAEQLNASKVNISDVGGSLPSPQNQLVNDAVSRKSANVEEISKDIPDEPVLGTQPQVTVFNEMEVNLERNDEKPRKRKKKSKSIGVEDKLPDKSQPAEVQIDKVTELNEMEVNLEGKDEETRKRKKKSRFNVLVDKLPDKSEPAEAEIDKVTELNGMEVSPEITEEKPRKRKMKSKSTDPEDKLPEKSEPAEVEIDKVTELNGMEVNLENTEERPRKKKKKTKPADLEDKLPDKSQPAEVETGKVTELNEMEVNLDEKPRKRKKKTKSSSTEDKLPEKDLSDHKAPSDKENMITSATSGQEASDAARSLLPSQKSNEAIEENQRAPSKSTDLENSKKGGERINFHEYFAPGKDSRNDEMVAEQCESNEGTEILKNRTATPESGRAVSTPGGMIETNGAPKEPKHSNFPTLSSSRKENSAATDKSSACNSDTSPQKKGHISSQSGRRVVADNAAMRSSQKKSSLIKPESIFEADSTDSSADRKEKAHLGDSNKSSSELVHTDGESALSLDSGASKAVERSNSEEKFCTPKLDGFVSKDITMDVILRSSKMFKRALHQASQGEPDLPNSQPPEFVPESQPL